MTRFDYLKSRGWKLTRYGWAKNGWELQLDQAVCLEFFVAGRGEKLPIPIAAKAEHLNAAYPTAHQIEAATERLKRTA